MEEVNMNTEVNDTDKKLHISDVSVLFPKTIEGAKNAGEYLKSIDRMKDFWFHPSSHDIINHANKLWNELN